MKNVCLEKNLQPSLKITQIVCYFAFFIVFMRNVVPQPIDSGEEYIDSDDPFYDECPELEEDIPPIYEYGDFFEGDMDLNDDQLAAISGDMSVFKEQNYRWPNGIVPYIISEDYTVEQSETILRALAHIEKVSCVKFIPRTYESDYIHVEAKDSYCYSKVGRQGGKQYLNLGKSEPGEKCLAVGTIMHEFLHALGFYHMQSVSNRDKYIKVNMENVEEGKEHNFQKYNYSFVTDINMVYDYASIMHFRSTAFSKHTYSPTILPRNGNYTLEFIMGQREGLSKIDILKINKMYECETQKTESGDVISTIAVAIPTSIPFRILFNWIYPFFRKIDD